MLGMIFLTTWLEMMLKQYSLMQFVILLHLKGLVGKMDLVGLKTLASGALLD